MEHVELICATVFGCVLVIGYSVKEIFIAKYSECDCDEEVEG